MGLFDNINKEEIISRMQKAKDALLTSTERINSGSNADITSNFCSNCGTKLNEGAKFCHGCGVAVGAVSTVNEQVTPTIPPITPVASQSKPTERQQEFAGKIIKCPHCGGVISETTAICPDCGMQIMVRLLN